MRRKYLRYAINDALDRQGYASLLRLPRDLLTSAIAIRNRKIKSRTFLGEKSAKNNEEIKSTSNQDTRFDLIGFGVDKYDSLFASVRFTKHKLQSSTIRTCLSKIDVLIFWIYITLKFRKIVGIKYIARYVAGYHYASTLNIETRILVLCETRNAYIYGILDGLEKLGVKSKKVFLSHLLASGPQEKFFHEDDHIISVTNDNCVLYNKSSEKQFATCVFYLLDGYRLGLDKRILNDVWVWVGQEVLFEQEKEPLKKLIAVAKARQIRLIYWARNTVSFDKIKGWLSHHGIEAEVTERATYFPKVGFGNYSNLLMVLSIFGASAFTFLGKEKNIGKFLLNQMSEYGVRDIDACWFLHDTNVPYQGDAISLPDFESESRSVIEFICS